ncbi:MAG: leucine-rich repeat protein, partial [Tenericutes bacterium]|nr:leucine-rich repeat protein [Mycoplasmatota bacterium]
MKRNIFVFLMLVVFAFFLAGCDFLNPTTTTAATTAATTTTTEATTTTVTTTFEVTTIESTTMPVTTVDNSSPVEDFEFTLKEDNTYELTGYIGDEETVIIPSTYEGKSVTSIGRLAFYNEANVNYLEIPSSITTIDAAAIYSCLELSEVVVDEANSYYSSVDGVLFNKDKTVLMYYPSNKPEASYIVPSSVISIGNLAFVLNDNLISITIPRSVERIKEWTFRDYKNFNNITVVEENSYYSSIDGVLFDKDQTTLLIYPLGKSETSYIIPDDVLRIGRLSFVGNLNLVSITLPYGLTYIDNWAFYECANLENVDLPETVTTLGESIFGFCDSMTSIYLQDSIVSIGPSLFFGSENFMSIEVSETNDYFSSLDGVLFNKDKTEILEYPAGISDTVYEIPTGVISIADWAFSYAANIVDIIIPNTVTSIGKYSFSDCYGLENVIIPDSVTSLGAWSFADNLNLQSIFIPDSVDFIGGYAFYNCGNLTVYTEFASKPISWDSIWNPDPVSVEWNYLGNTESTISFEVNGGSNVIDITQNVGTILDAPMFPVKEGFKFDGWYSDSELANEYTFEVMPIEDITVYVKWMPLIEDSTDNYTFELYTDGTYEVTGFLGDYSDLVIPSQYQGISVTSIGNWAFEHLNITSVVIPNTVTYIGYNSFSDCRDLVSVYIPSSVTYISYSAFAKCDSLIEIRVGDLNSVFADEDGILFNKDKTVLFRYPPGKPETEYIIPLTVTSINDWAFHGCINLTKLTITENVINTGYAAFSYCNLLTSIEVDEGNLNFVSENGVLFNIEKTILLAYPIGKQENIFVVPEYVDRIEANSFSGSQYIEYLIIRNGVKVIGQNAFRDMSFLKEVTLPNTLEVLENNVFTHCHSLIQIFIPYNLNEIGYANFYDVPELLNIFVDDQNPYFDSDNGILFDESGTILIAFPSGRGDHVYLVPDTVNYIREDAFSYNDEIVAIYIPASVEFITEYAVMYCDNVTIYTEFEEAPIGWSE